jgi:hypothetical protein
MLGQNIATVFRQACDVLAEDFRYGGELELPMSPTFFGVCFDLLDS